MKNVLKFTAGMICMLLPLGLVICALYAGFNGRGEMAFCTALAAAISGVISIEVVGNLINSMD